MVSLSLSLSLSSADRSTKERALESPVVFLIPRNYAHSLGEQGSNNCGSRPDNFVVLFGSLWKWLRMEDHLCLSRRSSSSDYLPVIHAGEEPELCYSSYPIPSSARVVSTSWSCLPDCFPLLSSVSGRTWIERTPTTLTVHAAMVNAVNTCGPPYLPQHNRGKSICQSPLWGGGNRG